MGVFKSKMMGREPTLKQIRKIKEYVYIEPLYVHRENYLKREIDGWLYAESC